MSRPFPNPGNVIYNGFRFPTAINTRVRIHPVLTSDGRTIKYREYYLHLECIIVSDDFASPSINAQAMGVTLKDGAPIDEVMDVLRIKLTQNGKPLRWTNIGIGSDLLVSAAGTSSPAVWGVKGIFPDMDFGPKVLDFSWTPIGGNRAAMISWDCKVTLACEETFNENGSLINLFGEFCWGASFSINEQGLTTRQITGSAEAPVWREGAAISSTADMLRPLIRFPLLEGFTRDQNWQLSPDKRRLDFNVVDRELPSENPLYPGCVRMDVRHRIASGLAIGGGGSGGFRLWSSSISGTIELAPGVARGTAWLAFLVLLNDRLGQSKTPAESGEPDKEQGITYISRIELEESIFRRQFSFHVTYGITSRLRNILKASGMWRPMPGQWSYWTLSMGGNDPNGLVPQSVFGPLGQAGLRHRATDDVIVDFCNPFNQPATAAYEPTQKSAVYEALQPPCPPDDDASWVRYDNHIEFYRETGTVVHQILGDSDATEQSTLGQAAASAISVGLIAATGTPPQTKNNVVQASGLSLMVALLVGSAVRIGRRVDPPKLVSIGDSPAVLKDEQITSNKLIGYTGDCPMYFARWRRAYHVYAPTGQIQIDGIPPRFQDTQANNTP